MMKKMMMKNLSKKPLTSHKLKGLQLEVKLFNFNVINTSELCKVQIPRFLQTKYCHKGGGTY